MNLRPALKPCAWCFATLALVGLAAVASAQSVPPAPSNQVSMSLDRDLITFVQWFASISALILAAFAGFIVWFFGVDVAQTRKAMLDAREDIAGRLDAIRSDHQTLRELKERLQKLGAELVDEIEKAKAATGGPANPIPKRDAAPDDQELPGPLTQVWEMEERKRKRIRDMLATSEFEWSTIGTLQKKTKLSPEEIETLARNDPLVQVGQGQQGATLLRLKEFNFPGGIGFAYNAAKIEPVVFGSGSRAEKAFRDAVAKHAQEGKRPGGKVLGGQ